MSGSRGEVTTPPYAALALSLSVEEWDKLGIETIEQNPDTGSTSDITILTDRVTALLLIRLVAIGNYIQKAEDKSKSSLNFPGFSDYSTTTICRTVLVEQQPWEYYAPSVTDIVISQLRNYVDTILSGYNDVPYHNREHAFHVILSSNKLMDMMLSQPRTETKTFGLRDDPIKLCALIFAALIHDVEHLGIPNRQLLLDRYHLAILYNDQSIAENRSVYIGFSILLEDESFSDLCDMMFNGNLDSDLFRTFRQTVINLVLQTDIASAERVQIGKSKWKEAFGEPFETLERKVLRGMGRGRTLSSGSIDSMVSDSDTPTEFDDCNVDYDDDEDANNNDCNTDGVIFSGKVGTGKFSTTNQKVQSIVTEDVSINEASLDGADSCYESAREIPNRSSQKFIKSEFSSVAINFEFDDDSSKADIDYGYDDSGSKLQTAAGIANNKLLDAGQGKVNVQQSPKVDDSNEDKSNSSNVLLQRNGMSYQATSQRKCSLDSNVNMPKRYRNGLRGSVGSDVISSKRLSLPSIASNEKFRRRMSTRHSAPESTLSYRKRLGIRRSMDLSGEAIEMYQKRQSDEAIGKSNDLPDDLKATVVLETMITAADVAHNLQGWLQMRKWSGRLYLELRRAFVHGKGVDPRGRWYENQLGFLESYLLPLARRLEDTGVFGYEQGQCFANIVESNRDKWLLDGSYVTNEIIAHGEETSFDDSIIYPKKKKFTI